ncbi:MAG: SHOCT domain-containing protein [Bacteroidota bacterium]
MAILSSLGNQKISEFAQKYGISEDAVRTLMYAVQMGNGSMAQFNHPELGGMGQWMQGGMTMVGDMFNQQAKNTVIGLCNELSGFIYEPSYWMQEEPVNPIASNPGSAKPVNKNWWPEAYGSPDSLGGQNNSEYALFNTKKRLVIKEGDKVTIYDILNYVIHGFSQQQGSGAPSLKISTFTGEITLDNLKVVEE